MEENRYRTPQEEFWAGDFGNNYIGRNASDNLLSSNVSLFSTILKRTRDVNTILELGANIGMNLKAIHRLNSSLEMTGVEINKQAYDELLKLPKVIAIHSSFLDFAPSQTYDFVFTKTVLIHVNPDYLEQVYDIMYRCSKKYLMVAEYYNPSPAMVKYRNNEDKLFKRDFAGDLLSRFNDIRLVDYGFVYHRDVNFPQDDISWFLLEKV